MVKGTFIRFLSKSFIINAYEDEKIQCLLSRIQFLTGQEKATGKKQRKEVDNKKCSNKLRATNISLLTRHFMWPVYLTDT